MLIAIFRQDVNLLKQIKDLLEDREIDYSFHASDKCFIACMEISFGVLSIWECLEILVDKISVS